MVRKYALTEKGALIRERYVYGTAHVFLAYLYVIAMYFYRPIVVIIHWRYHLKNTVSGKETGNQGLEKYWRFRRIDSRTPNWSATITAQMTVRSSAMALSPLMPLEPSVDNNRQ